MHAFAFLPPDFLARRPYLRYNHSKLAFRFAATSPSFDVEGAEEEEEEWGLADEAVLEEEARLSDLYDSPVAVPPKPHGLLEGRVAAAGTSRQASEGRTGGGAVVVLDDDSDEDGDLEVAGGFEEQDGEYERGSEGEQGELDKVSRAESIGRDLLGGELMPCSRSSSASSSTWMHRSESSSPSARLSSATVPPSPPPSKLAKPPPLETLSPPLSLPKPRARSTTRRAPSNGQRKHSKSPRASLASKRSVFARRQRSTRASMEGSLSA